MTRKIHWGLAGQSEIGASAQIDVGTNNNDLFLTMALLICVMLHCNIQMFERQSPQKCELSENCRPTHRRIR
jgi:hypothetical protein